MFLCKSDNIVGLKMIINLYVEFVKDWCCCSRKSRVGSLNNEELKKKRLKITVLDNDASRYYWIMIVYTIGPPFSSKLISNKLTNSIQKSYCKPVSKPTRSFTLRRNCWIVNFHWNKLKPRLIRSFNSSQSQICLSGGFESFFIHSSRPHWAGQMWHC